MGDNYRFKETETTMLSPTTLKFVDTKSFRVVIPGMNEWVGDTWDEINYELPMVTAELCEVVVICLFLAKDEPYCIGVFGLFE